MNAPWSMTEDGEWILAEPYASKLTECKLGATKAWKDAVIDYMARETRYGKDELMAELLRRNEVDDKMGKVNLVDEFIIEALSGDL